MNADEKAYFVRTNGPTSPATIKAAFGGSSDEARVNSAVLGGSLEAFHNALALEQMKAQADNPDRFIIKLNQLRGARKTPFRRKP